MGLESPESWRSMLSSCAVDLAKGYKIKPEHLKWYAAFHDNSHHPHVHMILYSTEPTEGFLTKQGITQIKSVLAQRIFPGQLQELYAADTKQRDELKAEARARYLELIEKMSAGTLQNEHIETLTMHLAEKLEAHRGKLQYGYLQAPVKAIVDEIVNELAQDPRIAEAYRLWYEIRIDILSTYHDDAQEIPPLSTQKEFKPVHNMVITEAAKLIGQNFSPEAFVSGESTEVEKQDATGVEPNLSLHQSGQQTTGAKLPSTQQKEPPSVVSSATRLLRHMSRIFQNSMPSAGQDRIQIDKKLRRKLRQKKIAQGHKTDDHADTINMTM